MPQLARQPKSSRIADRPVSVGFIGARNVLWPYLQALDCLITSGEAVLGGICARNRRHWATIQAHRPGAALLCQPSVLLAADIDIVVITTPPGSHAKLAREALSKGEHVLVETPLAESIGDARAVIAIACRRRLLLVAASFVHLSPTFVFLRQQLAQGNIGEIPNARGLYCNLGSDWASWYHESGIGPLAAIEPTWHWTDGLIDVVRALRKSRAPVANLAHDLHLIEVLAAASALRDTGRPVKIRAPSFSLPLTPTEGRFARNKTRHLHDNTRLAVLQ